MNGVTIKRASEVMGKSQQYIRIGLQRGLLPIGNAEKMPNSSKFSYYVSPKLLSDYTGVAMNEI